MLRNTLPGAELEISAECSIQRPGAEHAQHRVWGRLGIQTGGFISVCRQGVHQAPECLSCVH